MGKQSNAVNFTGLERFVVDASGAFGAYTTVQEAVNAASSAGGGNVYLTTGVFNETVTVPNGVTLAALNGNSIASAVGINGGLIFDATAGFCTSSVENLSITGNGGAAVRTTGGNDVTVTFTNCRIDANTETAVARATTGIYRFFMCNMEAQSGEKLFDLSAGTCLFFDCNITGSDTFSTTSGTFDSIFFFSGICNDSFDISAGQVIVLNCVISPISTLPFAVVHLNCACGTPGCIITDNQSASGFFFEGNGVGDSGTAFFFSFAQAPDVVMPLAFDPDLTVLGLNELPYGEAGVTATAIRGNVALDSRTFSVTDGFVTTTGSSAAWKNTTASQNIVNGEGYNVSSGAVVLTLPTTAAFGTSFKVSLQGGTSWQIAQNGGQSIRFGVSSTSVGAGGSITSVAQGDTLTLVCDVANLHWFVEASIGNAVIV